MPRRSLPSGGLIRPRHGAPAPVLPPVTLLLRCFLPACAAHTCSRVGQTLKVRSLVLRLLLALAELDIAEIRRRDSSERRGLTRGGRHCLSALKTWGRKSSTPSTLEHS